MTRLYTFYDGDSIDKGVKGVNKGLESLLDCL